MDNPVKIISEIIKKESIVLGPAAALMVASSVQAIKLSPQGDVTAVKGDIAQVSKELIAKYVELAGVCVKSPVEHYL